VLLLSARCYCRKQTLLVLLSCHLVINHPFSYVNHMIQPRLLRGMPNILSRVTHYRLIRHSSTVVINSLLNAKHDPSSNSLSDSSVTVNGYVRSLRKQKRVTFAAIGDGSTIDSLQAVLKPEQAIGYEAPNSEQ